MKGGVVLVVAIVLASCASESAPYLRVERIGGDVVDCLLGDLDVERRVARVLPGSMKKLGARAVYGGMSGAPVYLSGRCVGALHAHIERGDSAWFEFTPVSEIRKWGAISAVGRESFADSQETEAAIVEPGSAVGTFRIWGDLHLGMSGIVSLVEGRRVFCFGHTVGGSSGGRHTVRALVKVTPIVVFDRPDGSRSEVVFQQGPLIGGTYFDGPRGVIGEIGLVPPHVKMLIVWVRDGAVVRRKTLYVTRNEDVDVDVSVIVSAMGSWVLPGSTLVARKVTGTDGLGVAAPPKASVVGRWSGSRFAECIRTLLERVYTGDAVELRVCLQ